MAQVMSKMMEIRSPKQFKIMLKSTPIIVLTYCPTYDKKYFKKLSQTYLKMMLKTTPIFFLKDEPKYKRQNVKM